MVTWLFLVNCRKILLAAGRNHLGAGSLGRGEAGTRAVAAGVAEREGASVCFGLAQTGGPAEAGGVTWARAGGVA